MKPYDSAAPGVRPGPRRSWSDLGRETRPYLRGLPRAQREHLRPILMSDMLSEYDARFFSAFVRNLGIPFTQAFWDLERRWAADEARHHEGFLDVLAGYDEPDRIAESLEGRSADFEPLAHLFEDEFAIACLGAYDELVTVRANAHRLEEAPRVIERIRSAEGIRYGNTFFLDHDDDVFTEELSDAAARILLEQLERARESSVGQEPNFL